MKGVTVFGFLYMRGLEGEEVVWRFIMLTWFSTVSNTQQQRHSQGEGKYTKLKIKSTSHPPFLFFISFSPLNSLTNERTVRAECYIKYIRDIKWSTFIGYVTKHKTIPISSYPPPKVTFFLPLFLTVYFVCVCIFFGILWRSPNGTGRESHRA